MKLWLRVLKKCKLSKILFKNKTDSKWALSRDYALIKISHLIVRWILFVLFSIRFWGLVGQPKKFLLNNILKPLINCTQNIYVLLPILISEIWSQFSQFVLFDIASIHWCWDSNVKCQHPVSKLFSTYYIYYGRWLWHKNVPGRQSSLLSTTSQVHLFAACRRRSKFFVI